MKYREHIIINEQTELNVYLDEKMKIMLTEFIEPTIKELCFSFCVDSKTMHDILYETYDLRMQLKENNLDCNDENYRKKEDYEKVEFDRLGYVRLQNTTKRFVAMNSCAKFSGLMLNQERIYDSIMYEEMVLLYLKYIHLFYDLEDYERFMNREIEWIKTIPEEKELYGYTNRINREEKFTFLEAIVYSSILCCTEGRSVNVLNKELIGKRDCERAKKWFSKLSMVFFSDELRDSLVSIVVDFVYYKVAKYCNELYDDYKSIEKMAKKSTGKRNLFETEYGDELCTKQCVLWGYNKIRIILLFAELIAMDIFPKELSVKQGEKVVDVFDGYNAKVSALNQEIKSLPEWDSITKEDYRYASKLADLFLKFVEDALKSAANLLKCLPEAIVAEDKEMYDYLQERYDLT